MLAGNIASNNPVAIRSNSDWPLIGNLIGNLIGIITQKPRADSTEGTGPCQSIGHHAAIAVENAVADSFDPT